MLDKNILGVIKDDMNELVHRLNFHQEGYLKVFSLERTRKHFDDIFFSRYKTITGSDLATLPDECLQVVSRFYHEVIDLYFYFKMTEDMPSAVSNKLSVSLRIINDLHTEFIDSIIKGDNFTSLEVEDRELSNIIIPENNNEKLFKEDEELLDVSEDDSSGDENETITIDELEENDPPPFVK
jgi:hypothetical protein